MVAYYDSKFWLCAPILCNAVAILCSLIEDVYFQAELQYGPAKHLEHLLKTKS